MQSYSETAETLTVTCHSYRQYKQFDQIWADKNSTDNFRIYWSRSCRKNQQSSLLQKWESAVRTNKTYLKNLQEYTWNLCSLLGFR